MNRHENDKSERKVEMNIGPLMPVKSEEVFGTFRRCGPLGNDKAHQKSDQRNAHD